MAADCDGKDAADELPGTELGGHFVLCEDDVVDGGPVDVVPCALVVSEGAETGGLDGGAGGPVNEVGGKELDGVLEGDGVCDERAEGARHAAASEESGDVEQAEDGDAQLSGQCREHRGVEAMRVE